jgi:hypothetical protein
MEDRGAHIMPIILGTSLIYTSETNVIRYLNGAGQKDGISFDSL